MAPVRLLFVRTTETNEEELPSETGMLPVRLFPERRKSERLRVPNPSGMLPVRELLARSIVCRREQDDSVFGIWPLRLLELRLR